jgi:zinc protease
VVDFTDQIANAKAIKLDDIKAFHAKFYGAQNGLAAIVGDFDNAEVQKQLAAKFGGFKVATKYARVPSPFQELKPTTLTLPTPDKANAFFGAATTFALKDTDPDYAALKMADNMLGGGFLSGRVPQRLREKEGLSYGAGTALNVNGFDNNGAMIGYAIYAPQNVAKIEQGFREEVQRAVDAGFTAAELTSAREGLMQARAQELADDGSLADRLVLDLDLGRTLDFDAKLDEKLKALPLADVNAALKKYVQPSKFTYIKAGDFKKPGA